MDKKIQNFYDLVAWKNAHEFVLDIYKITQNFPKEERFGIISQIRRAASSITANIAEGFERFHFKDKTRFYYQARGSAAEVQNFILLASRLDMIDSICNEDLLIKSKNIIQLINGLIRSIRNQR